MNQQPKSIIKLILSITPTTEWLKLRAVCKKFKQLIDELMPPYFDQFIHKFIEDQPILFNTHKFTSCMKFDFAIKEFNVNGQLDTLNVTINRIPYTFNLLTQQLKTFDWNQLETHPPLQLNINQSRFQILINNQTVIKYQNILDCFKTAPVICAKKRWYYNKNFTDRILYKQNGTSTDSNIATINGQYYIIDPQVKEFYNMTTLYRFLPINHFDQITYDYLNTYDGFKSVFDGDVCFQWMSCDYYTNHYDKICKINRKHYHRLNCDGKIIKRIIDHFIYGDFHELDSPSMMLNCSTFECKRFINTKFINLCKCTCNSVGQLNLCNKCHFAMPFLFK